MSEDTQEKSNVVEFTGSTTLEIDPKKILSNLLEAPPLQEIVAITRDAEGELHLYSSSGYGPDILWLIEHARAWVMEED